MRVEFGGRTFDSPSHYPKSRERPSHGPALRTYRGRPRADLRPDGRHELLSWRVPDDRDVPVLLSVRVLRDRSPVVGTFGRRGNVRVRSRNLSARGTLRHAG